MFPAPPVFAEITTGEVKVIRGADADADARACLSMSYESMKSSLSAESLAGGLDCLTLQRTSSDSSEDVMAALMAIAP